MSSPGLLGLVMAAILIVRAQSSTVTRCQVKSMLYVYNMPGNHTDWLCIAHRGSGYNTNAQVQKAGAEFNGIFQIADDHCRPHKRSNQTTCGMMLCSSLRDNAVYDDLECARTIFNAAGYSAWPTWTKFCQGQDLSSYLINC